MNLCAPPGADSVSSVNEDHGNDWHVVGGLDLLAVIVQMFEQRLVVRVHHVFHQRTVTNITFRIYNYFLPIKYQYMFL